MNSQRIREESVKIDLLVQKLQLDLIASATDKEHLAVRLTLLQTELAEAAGRLVGVRVQLCLLAPEKTLETTTRLHDVLTEAAWIRKPSFDFNHWLDVGKPPRKGL